MKRCHSLKTKLLTLGGGEEVVLFSIRGYKPLMRDIESIKSKNEQLNNITYKKAIVIVDEKMKIGVLIKNNIGK